MADKMLIDASHEEETRVVVVRGSRIEEFDFESQHKKQLRGNIYLAKVTRVEPSLQAAFVDYGGNRHGFLAFSEIHPDYYQIPLADRQALLAAEAEAEAERARREADDDDDEEAAEAEEAPRRAEAEEKAKSKRSRSRRSGRGSKKNAEAAGEGESADAVEEVEAEEVDAIDTAAQDLEGSGADAEDDRSEDGTDEDAVQTEAGSDEDPDDDDDGGEGGPRSMAAIVETDSISEPVGSEGGDDEDTDVDPGEVDQEAAEFVEGKAEESPRPRRSRARGRRSRADNDDRRADSDEGDGETRSSRRHDEHEEDSRVESVGAEDAMEEVPDRSVRKPRKQYRIQEVIKRRQILLVQVVKEERGNKGAALTTYLSLAGRYSVLMPNTARGGGISRKITNIQDRKRLKEIAKGLEVPQGMGVILRTAGANRTKAEVKRDFEYLMRLWENVRSLTLASTAPCLVYEEGSLIKRSIRDLYNKDISEVVVAGEEGYREAKDFMKMLMPSHAKVVQPYRDVHPIFSRSGIEAQLDRMLQPQVTLKSGGYIIINQTEALVAIDVNSGRSTKEHSIEDTALQTNLEAADEVARQLRLRDLAGLIVVDFIDMEEKRNNRSVEKRLKDALKNDRARIQVGRISHFGLLEMSRQRIRASVLESTTQICEHCGGTGHVRSQSSVALHVIRSVEEYLLKSTTHDIIIRTMPTTALYVLNHKRETIIEMERRFGVAITIEADASIGSSHLEIDRGAAVEVPVRIEDILPAPAPVEDEDEDVPVEIVDEDDEDEVEEQVGQPTHDEGDSQQKRKRRRRRRGGRDRDHDERAPAEGGDEAESEPVAAAHEGDAEDGERPKKRRRRGKRGGRRNRGEEGVHAESGMEADDAPVNAEEEAAETTAAESNEPATEAAAAEAPVTETAEAAPAEPEAAPAPVEASEEEAPAEKPKRRRSRSKKAEAEARVEAAADEQPSEQPAEAAAEPAVVTEEAEAAPAREEAPARAAAKPAAAGSVVSSNGNVSEGDKEAETAEKPKKVGWWQRRSFF